MRPRFLWSALFFLGLLRLPSAAADLEPPNPQFDKGLATLRAAAPELADECAKLNADLLPLAPYDTYDSALPDAAPAVLADFNRRFHAVQDHAQSAGLGKKDKANFDYVYQVIYDRLQRLSTHNVPAHLKQDAVKIGELEAKAAKLEADAKAAGGLSPAAKAALQDRLAKLNEEGTAVWNLVHADALNADDNPDGEAKEQGQVNPLQKRLADLGRRLHGVDAALNGEHPDNAEVGKKISAALAGRLNDPFGGAASESLAPGSANFRTGTNAAAPAKTLLDLRSTVPSPPPPAKTGPKPKVSTGYKKSEDSAPQETALVNALRAKGKTQTFGDPDGRAVYAFHQTGNTCGIGAQVQVLAIAGEVPADPEKLKAKEDELYARAVSLGYFEGSPEDPKRRENGGTPFQYLGDLLDMPVSKRYAASEKDLFNDAKAGRVVLINVDSGRFYNDPKLRGQGHSVAVTGVEVDSTGKALGYYVNDTGTGEAARFIAASQFLGAWKKFGSTIVEPQ